MSKVDTLTIMWYNDETPSGSHEVPNLATKRIIQKNSIWGLLCAVVTSNAGRLDIHSI